MTAVAIHPEAVRGEPSAVLWVTPVDLPAGEVLRAPGSLGPLIQYGVLSRVLVEKRGLWTWLAEGRSWGEHGPRIRDAIVAALSLPGWEIEESCDDLLRLVASHVLEFELGPFIASHGGAITLHSVTAGRVLLDFGGTCGDCPAAGITLHLRIERAIRERYPALAEIAKTGSPGRLPGWLVGRP